MHTSVIVVCMPSMVRCVKHCYCNISTALTGSKHSLFKDSSASNIKAQTPPPATGRAGSNASPTGKSKSRARRGPLSRMLQSLDNMTGTSRTRRTAVEGPVSRDDGSIWSQKELTVHSMEGTAIDRATPEYVDYSKLYAKYAQEQAPATLQLMEMRVVVGERHDAGAPPAVKAPREVHSGGARFPRS